MTFAVGYATSVATPLAQPPREGHPAWRKTMIRKLLVGVVAALMLGLVSVGFGARTASAEVTLNDRFPVTLTFDNPCESGLNLIRVSGFVHMLWYTTPDGATVMRFRAHYAGTDSDGTNYVVNSSRTMEHFAGWPTYAPFSDLVIVRLISKGSDDNARIEIVLEYSSVFVAPFASPYVTSVTCRG